MIRHPAPSVVRYVLVWVGLMILLALAFGTAYIPMGPFNTVANLVIALAKMLLVMIFFMHLSHAHPILRLFATLGFFMLAIMIGLTLSDFLTRSPVALPWQ